MALSITEQPRYTMGDMVQAYKRGYREGHVDCCELLATQITRVAGEAGIEAIPVIFLESLLKGVQVSVAEDKDTGQL